MSTPMRAQYLAMKQQYPDVILFFRLGDFYETFDDDAKIVASVCDLVLTSRPVGDGERVPLAGVPYHAVEGYVARLIGAGYKVAIAEQLGSEPQKGEKVVSRVVRRVVTPGTLVEPGLLTDKANNYIASLLVENDRAGLAYADITTGEFAATEIDDGANASRRAAEELARLGPAELLIPLRPPVHVGSRPRPSIDPGTANAAGSDTSAHFGGDLAAALPADHRTSPYPAWRFEKDTAQQALLAHFGAASLEGYGLGEKELALRAAGALLQYLEETQRDGLGQLTDLHLYDTSEFMTLDTATRRNLEITAGLRSGTPQGSLIGILDQTLTPMGARLLRRRINQPLLSVSAINHRLDIVGVFFADALTRSEIRQLLKHLGDLERWTNRAVLDIAQPRDLLGIRDALARVDDIRALLARLEGLVSLFGLDELDPCDDVVSLVANAIADDPPATLTTSGVIRPGYSAELDGIHLATRDARTWIAGLEAVERQRTGIKSLKVGYNKVFGYYIEVTKANSELVPGDYIRKQTLVNAERYITPQLKEYEALVLNARERVLELEGQIYRLLLDQIAATAPRLLRTATALAEIDHVAALAEAAEANHYVRPRVDDSDVVDIKNGRHPVVERMPAGEQFTANDTYLSSDRAIVILTGPNMSGKSTYIRQVAMIVLMAQIGAFVPADSARIGLVDRIFTRIGASDEISRGQSTFMVEMVEAANILHNATPRSLLILDEIGRGTSTYDGLAIAWAVVEYVHNHPRLRSRTLFATHYHELTDLADRLPHVLNYNVAVAEQGDAVVFLHRIVPGAADRSYGVHVAQLAGLPRPITSRAQEILADLEATGAAGPRRSVAPPTMYQLPLFSRQDPILAEIEALDVNSLSPLDALNKLYELQQRLTKGK